MSETSYPTEPCRSCGEPVIWTKTERQLRSMPVNAEPTPEGNIVVLPGQISRVLPVADRFGRTDLRTSHFVTCPQAGKWRTRRSGGAS